MKNKIIRYKKCKNTVNRMKGNYNRGIDIVTFFNEFYKKYGGIMHEFGRR